MQFSEALLFNLHNQNKRMKIKEGLNIKNKHQGKNESSHLTSNYLQNDITIKT